MNIEALGENFMINKIIQSLTKIKQVISHHMMYELINCSKKHVK